MASFETCAASWLITANMLFIEFSTITKTGHDLADARFPAFAPLTSFPALGAGYMSFFSRSKYVFLDWHMLHIFQRLLPIAPFSAFGKSDKFSRARHRSFLFISSRNSGAALLLPS